MDNVAVVVSIERYEDLIRKEERINTLDRVVESCRYIGMEEVRAILRISQKEDMANGSN